MSKEKVYIVRKANHSISDCLVLACWLKIKYKINERETKKRIKDMLRSGRSVVEIVYTINKENLKRYPIVKHLN